MGTPVQSVKGAILSKGKGAAKFLTERQLLAHRLMAELETRGLNAEEVAKALGFERSWLKKWASREGAPSAALGVLWVCQALGLDPQDIVKLPDGITIARNWGQEPPAEPDEALRLRQLEKDVQGLRALYSRIVFWIEHPDQRPGSIAGGRRETDPWRSTEQDESWE